MDKLKNIVLKSLEENSFEGAPGGRAGISNYGGSYGTPGGGNITQDPSKFSSSDKTVNHMDNQVTSSAAIPRMPDRPDQVNNDRSRAISTDDAGEDIDNQIQKPNHIAPFDKAEKAQSEKPLDPAKDFDNDVNQLFDKDKGVTPSPDDIMSALQYELSQMVKKDKAIAKKTVLDNLKKDPQYYSRLHMLNIDDKEMKVDESRHARTKAVLDEMIASKKKQVTNKPEFDNIFNDLWKRRYGYSRSTDEQK